MASLKSRSSKTLGGSKSSVPKTFFAVLCGRSATPCGLRGGANWYWNEGRWDYGGGPAIYFSLEEAQQNPMHQYNPDFYYIVEIDL